MRSDEEMRESTVGEPRIHDAPITLADYDPAWPQRFAAEEARIRAALGERAAQRRRYVQDYADAKTQAIEDRGGESRKDPA